MRKGAHVRKRLVTVLLAVIAAILAVPAAAVADTQGGEAIVANIRDDNRDPVEGVTVTVFQGDEEIGSAASDPEGRARVEVPGPGRDYRAVLDTETLPEGLVTSDGENERAGFQVREGRDGLIAFSLVPEGQQETADDASPTPAESADGGQDDPGAAADPESDVEPGFTPGVSFGAKAAQLAVSGLIFGLVIAISAIGLSLIFGTTRMINFAHGDLVTFGAIMAMIFSTGAGGIGNSLLVLFGAGLLAAGAGWLLRGRVPGAVAAVVPALVLLLGVAASTAVGVYGESWNWEVPLLAAILIAVVLGALLGIGMERYVWQPLRARHVALIQMFIVSIGLSLLLRHLLLVVFGGNRQRYDEFQLQETLSLGPVSITPRDLTIVVLSVVVLVAVACMLQFTRIGKAMRAVSDNRDLAESSGIDVNRVTLYVWGMGGGLAALGGTFYGLNQTVYWQMGFHLLLLMFAAVILGGLGTAYGAMVGGLVIGLVAQLSTLWFSAQLMNAWALAIMILVLLVRPQGILGRRERVG
ncbi:branched-chain amino acid ABC transporter permease [Actinorugispora endophytica]|uniref:Branched-chain amino acid transport system permease protein n=1 Tax=Actinorugispora endophytica TaxID=1605990 RepID=A0A4R6UQQ1_9ACTN|nr:branched-chain amino acid ABC transporter permease [Actinorugispora endophytica]TDQ48536.1 branched-chain amino acid transport system permease protein [Actinorugispora endophytica]